MLRELDFTAAWNDAMAMLKQNGEATLAIAGVFIFLVQLVFGFFFPQPNFQTGGNDNAVLQLVLDYYKQAGLWLLIMAIVSGIGGLAIFFLGLNPKNPTTGEAIVLGAKHYITVLLASLITAIPIAIGFLFLLVPGIYLAVKFSQVSAVVAAEDEFNPITALSRSWAITKGNSLRIFGFVLIVGIVGAIAVLIFNLIFAGIGLVLPETAGLFVTSLGSAISSTAFSVLIYFVLMGIYRQLTDAY